jgi:hypothetical protein
MSKKKITGDMDMNDCTDQEIAEFLTQKMVRGFLSDNDEDKEDSLRFLNGLGVLHENGEK